jgi:hypothetical protein
VRHLDGGVMTPSDDLRIHRVRRDGGNGSTVTAQSLDLMLGANIPYLLTHTTQTCDGTSKTCDRT